MKRRYWITSIFIVFALVGQTICYAVILKPVDGTEFNSESDFPIQFRWKEDPEPKHLIVWRLVDGDEFTYAVSGDGCFRGEADLKMNSRYRWGVTHTREESPTETATFTVAILPEGRNVDPNKGGPVKKQEKSNIVKEPIIVTPKIEDDIQVEIMPPPELDFDQKDYRLFVKWEPKSTLIGQIDHYEVNWTDSGNPTVRTTAQTIKEGYIIRNIQPDKTYRVDIITYNSKGKIIARSKVAEKDTIVEKPKINNFGVEPEENRSGWRKWSRRILIFSGILLGLFALYVLLGQKLKLKLKQYTDDESYYWEPRKRKELLTTSNNYVEDRTIMNLVRSVKSIHGKLQDMKEWDRWNKAHIQDLRNEIQQVRERIQGGIEDYVSASQFKSKTELLETLLSQSIERLREDSHREMEQLNEKIASLENDLITLRQERLADKNAAVVAARKELDILIEQLTTALPQDAANLLNALSFASHADALSHLVEVGQRLLSEICSSKSSASLRAYIETMDKLQEIREKLDRLLTRTLPDAEQRSSRLLREAQEILTGYTDTKISKSFNSELIERTRRALLKEIGMPYISIVMGRFRGNGDKAYTQLAETLQQLGLDLIDITIGQTRPDERLHDVQSAMPPDKYPSGTIANVVKMGYIERATGEISKAQVIVSQ